MTVTLTDQDLDAIRFVADLAIAQGMPDQEPERHLRVAQIIKPTLDALRTAELARGASIPIG